MVGDEDGESEPKIEVLACTGKMDGLDEGDELGATDGVSLVVITTVRDGEADGEADGLSDG